MVTLRCFGRLEIEKSSGEIIGLRSRKHLALLLYLGAHPRRTQSRAKLARLLWETEPARARHSLSQALYDIRSRIRDIRLEGTASEVTLQAGAIRLEAATFEEAVRTEDLSTAVSLYRGEFAPHLETLGTRPFEDWIESERTRLRRLAELALARYVRQSDAHARWGEMCVAALRLVEMNPLNQDAHRALMRGLWLRGDQKSALGHFHEVEPFLQREIPGGIDEETRDLVNRIRSSRPSARVAESPSRYKDLDMVGRTAEFERLKQDLARVTEGGGRFVVLQGEAGIGKTRLLTEFGRVVELEGARLVESRCYSAESEVAYGPIVDGLSEVIEEATRQSGTEADTRYFQLGHLFPAAIGDAPTKDSDVEPATGRRRLYEEIADVLRRACRDRPLVWLVEDVHWIDASSASLLHYLARRLHEHPFLLLVSARSRGERNEAADELIQAWAATDQSVVLDLPRLTEGEIGRIVTSVMGDDANEETVGFVQKLAGGNPFFALEVLREIMESQRLGPRPEFSRRMLTERVRGLLNVRLRGLTPEAMRILEVVSVLERHAYPRFVAHLVGLPTSRMSAIARTLYSRGLLRDAGEVLELPHDITREFIYENMGQLPRAAFHLAVAELLSAEPDSVSPGTLARHFRLGGDRARAYEYALRAAKLYEQSFAHEEAANLAESALGQARSDANRARALETLAKAELPLGRLAAAQAHLEDLFALSSPLTARRQVDLRLNLARARVEMSDWEGARTAFVSLESDLEKVEGAARLDREMELLYLRLKVAMRRKEDEEAAAIVDKIRMRLTLEETSLTPTSRIHALCGLAVYTALYQSSQKAVTYLKEANAYLNEVSADVRLKSLLLKSLVSLRQAQWDEAEYQLESGLELARKHKDTVQTYNLLNNLGCCALEQGDWKVAKELYQKSTALAAVLPDTLFNKLTPLVNLGNCYLYSSKPKAAESKFEEALELANSIEARPHALDLHACLGITAIQLGKREQALRSWKRVRHVTLESSGGVQDRFKIEWLNASMVWLSKAGFVSQRLRTAAQAEKEIDVPGYLKLLWLADCFENVLEKKEAQAGGREVATRKLLYRSRLGWFVRFSERWMRQATRNIDSWAEIDLDLPESEVIAASG